MGIHMLVFLFMVLLFEGLNADTLKWRPEVPKKDLYRVIWNSRVEKCGAKFGPVINLTQWGIEQNKYGNGWHGDVISLIGSGKYGAWPRTSKTGDIYNGGLPWDTTNFTWHFERAAANLDHDLSKDWHGLGVFDVELYRPLFKQNFGGYSRYKGYAMDLVKKEHPDWKKAQLTQEATRKWNDASRKLWAGTLLLARKLRKAEGFGYYHFPQCFGLNRQRTRCSGHDENNQMHWLWNVSTALFPSIYFYNSQPNVTRRRLSVYGNVLESVRLREYVQKPHMPIYPYSKYNIRLHPTTLYTMVDLINSIGQVADLGVEGIVLWGDGWSQTNASRCRETKNYIDNFLGPFVKTVKQFVQKCSAAICNSNGRCYTTALSRILDESVYSFGIKAYKSFQTRVANSYTIFSENGSNELRIQALTFVGKVVTAKFAELHTDEHINSDLYQCRCFSGYYGNQCEYQFEK